MDIILASASPRRRELLKLITENFTAVAIDADESLDDNISAEDAAAVLSKRKAQAAAEMYPDSLVVGCDTTVVIDGKVLGKPRDPQQCRKFLRLLSGRQHQVITGYTVICGDKCVTGKEVTDVSFRTLSDEDIDWYISTGEPFDKAGGYGIQGKGALLSDGIRGDFYNVVGLPVSALYQVLKTFNIQED